MFSLLRLLKRDAKEALVSSLSSREWARYLSAVSKVAWNRALAQRLGGAMPLRPLCGDLVWDTKARPVTAREAAEGRWRLSDVVMPVPRPGEAVGESGGRLTMEVGVEVLNQVTSCSLM